MVNIEMEDSAVLDFDFDSIRLRFPFLRLKTSQGYLIRPKMIHSVIFLDREALERRLASLITSALMRIKSKNKEFQNAIVECIITVIYM
jgi:hypothetical protein